MLKFYKIADAAAGAGVVAQRLTDELSADKNVLWLVSGGSNIPTEVAVLQKVPAELRMRLTIMLSDERYGAVGHADSNIRQLQDTGFAPGDATVIPVLTADELSLEAAAKRYGKVITDAFESADIVIAQLGMGPDGHITGILPGSPAITANGLVAGYDAGQFERITLTFAALKHCAAAYVFAFGDAKRAQLEHLRDQDLPLAEQPAQILKQIPESYVYNDQIGDDL